MKIPLSHRLQCCADHIAPGIRVADIGCDHGYLGIYLFRHGFAVPPSPEGTAEKCHPGRNRDGIAGRIYFCSASAAS